MYSKIEFGKQGLVNVCFAPKADISHPEWHVRFVPIADIVKSKAVILPTGFGYPFLTR